MENDKQATIAIEQKSEESVAEEMKEEEESLFARAMQPEMAGQTLRNFVVMSVLFSVNHGCTVACLSLATARLGSVGAWQSGTLYLTYTASAILGATYVTKTLGSRNALIAGMVLYCVYVGCFWVATTFDSFATFAALFGAAIGGVGGGFLWTAQGAYFSQASHEHSNQLAQPLSDSTSYLAGIFAPIYLFLELVLRLLSTLLTGLLTWRAIFGVYTLIAIAATALMGVVHNYPREDDEDDDSSRPRTSIFYKVTAAIQILIKDPKMKYMMGLNSVFGFAGAFVNSYINGEVVLAALNDTDSKYIGILSGWLALVAALMSWIFGKIQRKGAILIGGAICFFMVAFLFILVPNIQQWGWISLLVVYTLHGTGRATFESTLKASFADYFPEEKEGAFANIILQNGLSSAIGYVLTFRLLCERESRYCVKYSDGTLHDVLTFELIVCITGLLAILGYWRASAIRNSELNNQRVDLIENEDAVAA